MFDAETTILKEPAPSGHPEEQLKAWEKIGKWVTSLENIDNTRQSEKDQKFTTQEALAVIKRLEKIIIENGGEAKLGEMMRNTVAGGSKNLKKILDAKANGVEIPKHVKMLFSSYEIPAGSASISLEKVKEEYELISTYYHENKIELKQAKLHKGVLKTKEKIAKVIYIRMCKEFDEKGLFEFNKIKGLEGCTKFAEENGLIEPFEKLLKELGVDKEAKGLNAMKFDDSRFKKYFSKKRELDHDKKFKTMLYSDMKEELSEQDQPYAIFAREVFNKRRQK